MASRRTRLSAAAAILVVGLGGYTLYSVVARQGEGDLAQAPLNVTSNIQPALIMAVDDSSSMDSEMSTPTNDGALWWNTTSKSFIGLGLNDTAAAGQLNFNRVGNANATWKKYVYLFPYGGGTDGRSDLDAPNDHYAVPPVPDYGWARSFDVNRAYFNPTTAYRPWLESDGAFLQGIAGIDSTTGQVNPVSAPADPKRGTTRLNLTEPFAYDVDDGVFVFYSGMTVPSGTRYRIRGCDDTGVLGTPAERTADQSANSTGWPIAQGDRSVTGTATTGRCRIAVSYMPATFYVVGARAATVAAAIGYRAASILDDGAVTPAGEPLRRFTIIPDNFDAGRYQPAINNFANWFTYYRKRHLATRAGMSIAFGESRDSLRAGYFTINNRVNVVMRDLTVPAQKKALFDTHIFQLLGRGGTPNKEAVDYMGKQFQRGNRDEGRPILRSCQRNSGMLFTDGFSNASSISGFGNEDGGGAAPFAHPVFGDNQSGTMADIAAFYYKTNLRPDLAAGKVPVPSQCASPNPDPRLDCQTNPHMNFYGITLNSRGLQYDVNLPATADPYTNVPSWPTTFPNRHPSAIDDIWHGTINARGGFFNAASPNDITEAISQVLNSATASESPAGSIALTGARIGGGSLVVQPAYAVLNNGTDWHSTLTAQSVTASPTTGVATFATEWEASTRIPAAAARDNVWLGRGNRAAVRFNAAGLGNSLNTLCSNAARSMSRCTGAQLAALGGPGSPVTVDEAVAYLKGDQSREVDRTANGVLRYRRTRLGDIVNSTPVVSAPTDDYGYRSLPAPYGATYGTYLATTKSSRNSMVYVGANDGMLHAFDGRRASDGGGIERFAFVPQTVVGHMGNLLLPYVVADRNAQRFQHKYFVDGPITVSDAFYDGGWKTTLVATTGAGARGAFALDVSTAATSGSFGPSDRLWEVSDLNSELSQAVRDNIGHVLGKPVIVPIKTGAGAGTVRWRAVFGNGYNSVSKKAVLYLVDMEGSTATPRITMIEAQESGAPAGDNGIGNIVVVDRWAPNASDGGALTSRGRDGFADTVYAADQKGAVWKFDLREAAPANQTVPIFTTLRYTTGPDANTRQPILGGLTAAAGPGGGVMVFFGTGSFSFDGDATDASLQSIYAFNDLASASPATTLTRADLLQQSIVTTTTADGRLIRTTTTNTPTVLQRGWRIDLPTSERFVGYPRIESGIVFLPTYAANATVECGAEGSNWLYGLNALSGGAALSNVRFGSPTGASPGTGTGAIALNTGGTAPVKDVAVLTTQRLKPLGTGATQAQIDEAIDAQCSMVIQVAGADPAYLPRACGRQSWRQIQ